MSWVKHTEDTRLPDWLKLNLRSSCEFCGTEYENFYNDAEKCTNRRCPNPKCPGSLAQRIADMCEILGYEGIKEGRGLQLVKEHNLENWFDALAYISEEKPKVTLSQFMQIAFIPGINTMWNQYCKDCETLDDLLSSPDSTLRRTLESYQDLLRHGITCVELISGEPNFAYDAVIQGNVMLSGAFKGYNDRNNFVYAINKGFQGLVRLNIVGKRKTNVMCLIQEADQPNRGKAEVAIECGIPIMTPEDFIKWLQGEVSKRMAKE